MLGDEFGHPIVIHEAAEACSGITAPPQHRSGAVHAWTKVRD